MRRALIAVTAVSVLVALAAPVSAGQTAPTRGLRLVTTLHSLTGTHRWYVQTYGGHDVLGSFYGVHTDLAGKVTKINDGRKAVSGAVPAAASVSASAAKIRATAPGAVASLVVLPGHARLVWRVIDDVGVQTLVDATTGAVVSRKSIAQNDTGNGRVFDPNPVVTLQDEALTDHNDHNFTAILAAYKDVVLTNLDGSGHLYGDFAHVKGRHGPAYSPDLTFNYQRGNPWFEQVMAYYDVTGAERYIQSLGFADVNNEPQDISVDTYSGDNSFYIPGKDQIVFGKGGVDDAEDAEVIWHEYGHAIQDAQVPGFGAGHEAGSIGEGFGDYWAVTMSQPVSNGFHLVHADGAALPAPHGHQPEGGRRERRGPPRRRDLVPRAVGHPPGSRPRGDRHDHPRGAILVRAEHIVRRRGKRAGVNGEAPVRLGGLRRRAQGIRAPRHPVRTPTQARRRTGDLPVLRSANFLPPRSTTLDNGRPEAHSALEV
jgi:hypothetical protein